MNSRSPPQPTLLQDLSHVDDRDDLQQTFIQRINDAVALLMRLSQFQVGKLMNGMSSHRPASDIFHPLDEAFHLETGIVLRVTGDVVMDGP